MSRNIRERTLPYNMLVFSKSRSLPLNLLVASAAVQVLCATYFLRIPKFASVASLLFLAAGFLSAWCLLYLPPPVLSRKSLVNKQTGYKLLLWLAVVPVSYFFVRRILDGTPLRIEFADMLPIIAVMCGRFLHDQFTTVYNPITEIWNGVQPIYLPALWLPFSAALVFDFDLRWITVAGIWLSVLLCLLPQWRRSPLMAVHIFLLTLLLAWLHFDESNNVIRLTEEGVVYFYYTALATALLLNNAWLVGVCAALCLMSRYALVGWLPYAALCCIWCKEFKLLGKMLAAGGATMLLLLLPFGGKMISIQTSLPAQYVAHAQKVWQEYPQHFQNSLGMAKFFGPGGAALLHTILVWGSFVVPLVFWAFTYRRRLAIKTRLLAGLQISLSFFYSFLDVSYLYLFYTPVFVTLLLVGWYLPQGVKYCSSETANHPETV